MRQGSLHGGHRERMRKKLMENPANLTDHEIVEMLLYYNFLQGDTNELGHMLFNKGGKTFNGMLELSEKEIKEIDGLGEKTAILIRLLREMYIRLKKENLNTSKSKKITKNNISDKLHEIFMGEKEEKFVMITLDKDFNIINKNVVSKGNESAAVVSVKKVVEIALNDKAYAVILAHNHPNGILSASRADIKATKLISEALSIIEIPLFEHYIVTENSMVGILKHSLNS